MRNLAPLAVALPILLLATACGTKVDVPAPSAATTSLPLPEPAPSVVSIPISLTAETVAGKVERLVPRGQSKEDEWHELGKFPVVGTVYVREKWERDPLRFSISGDRAEVSAHV